MKNKLYNIFVLILIAAAFNFSHGAEGTQPHSGLVVKRNHEIILNIGKTKERHAPFSTFKVPLALMGFDAKILESKDSPKWAFREEYEKNFQSWYTREKGLEYHWCEDHTPLTFMKNSVVWYSHLITQKLGKEKFEDYVSRLNYGNGNVSGTPGKDDGLFNSWLGTSLEISPIEQVEFLEKLLANELPFSKDAMEKTREIMDRDEAWDGWKLYGKTGGGSGGNGWFIGWIEKDGERLVFAQYLDKADPGLDLTGLPVHKSVGLTAKEIIKRDVLKYLGVSGEK
ncbi:MAG: class D beta-lactamase [Alphaproteobacteria bacterium]|jgi:beta-lactamase class D|nr:class D beta-lactamase [Alphaproteobacteria bacterium]